MSDEVNKEASTFGDTILFLTAGTKVRAAAGAANLFDRGAAARAGSALFTKDLEVVGVVAIVATGINKMLEGGAANFD